MKEIAITNNNLPKVVIIGAGFAGMNLVKVLQKKPVQIILLDQNNYHQFQPLLYQVAIGGLEPDSVVSPVRKLFKSCSQNFRMDRTCYPDHLGAFREAGRGESDGPGKIESHAGRWRCN
jgi:NADH:ubiquinone reductase (H+-translocating)